MYYNSYFENCQVKTKQEDMYTLQEGDNGEQARGIHANTECPLGLGDSS